MEGKIQDAKRRGRSDGNPVVQPVNASDLEKLARKFPISEATRRRNQVGPVGPPAANPKPVEGMPLERVHKGKEKGGVGNVGSGGSGSYQIRIRVFSRRPADWDGYHVKEIIDGCVKAGFMVDDDWKHCPTGSITSCKVHSKEEERTEVEIIPL